MKHFIIALACIVFGYSYSFAQQKTPAIQKGYYSIGNNNQKLEKQQPVVTSDKHTNKGYYSINEKSKPNYIPLITVGQTTPPTKGYYSIGDNHRQLGNAAFN
jgi:hypothetical protein